MDELSPKRARELAQLLLMYSDGHSLEQKFGSGNEWHQFDGHFFSGSVWQYRVKDNLAASQQT